MGLDYKLKRANNIDGGWAWVIMMASFFCHFCCYGLAWSTGVFHVMFLRAFNQSSALTSWAASLISAMMFMSGPLASYMTNRWGVRWTICIGTVISSAGISVCSMATNIYLVYLAFGFCGGVGFGIVFIPSVSIIAYYFEKRRVLASGVAVSGVGIGMFAWPPIVTYLDQEFGWRGTMMLIGAINLNMLVAGAVMRPLENEHPVLSPSREELARNLGQLEGYHKRKTFSKIMHLGLCKRPEFLSLCVNNFLICFGLSVVFIHLSAFAVLKTGADYSQSAMLISANGIANLVGRLFFAFLGEIRKIGQNVTIVYMLCFVIAGVLTVITPLIPAYYGLVAYSVAFGFTTGCFGVYLFAIVLRLVGVERLPSAYGYVIVFEGLGMLSGAPVAGVMYDILRWYDASLYLGGAMIAISSLFVIPALRYGDVAEREAEENGEEYEPTPFHSTHSLMLDCVISTPVGSRIGKNSLLDVPSECPTPRSYRSRAGTCGSSSMREMQDMSTPRSVRKGRGHLLAAQSIVWVPRGSWVGKNSLLDASSVRGSMYSIGSRLSKSSAHGGSSIHGGPSWVRGSSSHRSLTPFGGSKRGKSSLLDIPAARRRGVSEGEGDKSSLLSETAVGIPGKSNLLDIPAVRRRNMSEGEAERVSLLDETAVDIPADIPEVVDIPADIPEGCERPTEPAQGLAEEPAVVVEKEDVL